MQEEETQKEIGNERREESYVILSTSGRSLLLIYPLPSPSCAVTLLLPAVRSSVPASPLSSGKVPCAITCDDAWAWVYRNSKRCVVGWVYFAVFGCIGVHFVTVGVIVIPWTVEIEFPCHLDPDNHNSRS